MNLSQPRSAGGRATLLLALLAASAAQSAAAETWRCGNVYSDRPCSGGQTIAIDDSRSAAQKRDADQSTRDAHAAARRLEKDRRRLEATEGRRAATLLEYQPHVFEKREPASSMHKPKKREKDPQYTSLHAPGAEKKTKKQKKARQASH